jgi:hypothetical protein
MHTRRGFERAFKAGEPRAGLVLTHIQKLYAAEREATEQNLAPQERGQLRQEKSISIYTDGEVERLSCYRLGMDPWAYLKDVLPKLGDTRFPASRLAELLPEAWLQQQLQQRQQL